MKIFVQVKTKSFKEKVEKISTNNFKVYLKQAPEKNKANEALIKLLADYFKVKKYQIILISGKTSKIKCFKII